MAKLYYEDRRRPRLIVRPRKVAVIGYGSQGHAHALNLRDSGIDVRVGLRPGSSSRAKAEAAGLRVAHGRRGRRRGGPRHDPAPRHRAGERSTRPRSRRTSRPATRCSSPTGSTSASGSITPPPGVDVAMVAPKGPGHLVRRTYTEGGGVPSLIAVSADATGKAMALALVLRRRARRDARRRARDDLRRGDRDRPLRRAGRALRRADRARHGRLRDPRRGRLPAGVRLLRVPARAEADRRPDVRAGHRRHALLDLRHRRVRRPHPRPADHRRPTSAPRCAGSSTRSRTAASPRSGSRRTGAGRPRFNELRAAGRSHPIEKVGAELRAMMPFVTAGRQRLEDVSGG